MFLNSLNEAQRKSFLALATKMAMSDGHVAVQEVALLQDLADSFGEDLDPPAEEVYGPVNKAPFTTRSSRVLTLGCMYLIAYIDEHFHVDESSVLKAIVEAFEFSDDEVQEIKTWAKAEAQLTADLAAIIERV